MPETCAYTYSLPELERMVSCQDPRPPAELSDPATVREPRGGNDMIFALHLVEGALRGHDDTRGMLASARDLLDVAADRTDRPGSRCQALLTLATMPLFEKRALTGVDSITADDLRKSYAEVVPVLGALFGECMTRSSDDVRGRLFGPLSAWIVTALLLRAGDGRRIAFPASHRESNSDYWLGNHHVGVVVPGDKGTVPRKIPVRVETGRFEPAGPESEDERRIREAGVLRIALLPVLREYFGDGSPPGVDIADKGHAWLYRVIDLMGHELAGDVGATRILDGVTNDLRRRIDIFVANNLVDGYITAPIPDKLREGLPGTLELVRAIGNYAVGMVSGSDAPVTRKLRRIVTLSLGSAGAIQFDSVTVRQWKELIEPKVMGRTADRASLLTGARSDELVAARTVRLVRSITFRRCGEPTFGPGIQLVTIGSNYSLSPAPAVAAGIMRFLSKRDIAKQLERPPDYAYDSDEDRMPQAKRHRR